MKRTKRHALAFTVRILLFLVFLTLIASILSCDKFRSAVDSVTAAIKDEPLVGEKIKILFVGDTSFGESYDGSPQLLEKEGYDYPLEKVGSLLRSSDFVITNLETPITNIPESPFKDQKTWNHWTSVEKAPEHLKKFNMHTFNLANNHTLDFGLPGLQQTFEVMKANDISWFGAGLSEEEAARPFVKSFTVGKKTLKLAVIGAFEYSRSYDLKYNFYAKGTVGGANRLDPAKIAAEIAKLKAEDPSTYAVVFPHWGGNYAWKNANQTKAGHAFLKGGADMVIGQGGHSMQEIERVNDCWIMYGVGNFMFLSPGRYKHLKTKPYSIMAQIIVAEGKDHIQMRMRLYPINSDNHATKYQVRPLNDKEFEEFASLLLEKSPLTPGEKKSVHRERDDFGRYLEFRVK